MLIICQSLLISQNKTLIKQREKDLLQKCDVANNITILTVRALVETTNSVPRGLVKEKVLEKQTCGEPCPSFFEVY